jgi:hypothetical protein
VGLTYYVKAVHIISTDEDPCRLGGLKALIAIINLCSVSTNKKYHIF